MHCVTCDRDVPLHFREAHERRNDKVKLVATALFTVIGAMFFVAGVVFPPLALLGIFMMVGALAIGGRPERCRRCFQRTIVVHSPPPAPTYVHTYAPSPSYSRPRPATPARPYVPDFGSSRGYGGYGSGIGSGLGSSAGFSRPAPAPASNLGVPLGFYNQFPGPGSNLGAPLGYFKRG